jgi:hypothetical protein
VVNARSSTVRSRAALLAVTLGSLLGIPTVQASEDSGLEVADYRSLRVVIEHLTPDAQRIGLTESAARNRVELRVRVAGIKPTEDVLGPAFLYVAINVAGTTFTVEASFTRPVTYSVGQRTLSRRAFTWHEGMIGTHGNNSGYILELLDQLLDRFLNEYLRANQ